ncbi:MAG: hypothetical protein Q7O12_00260 [Deltaproteobacteria bacterium]|nr:hypothetical protein [Deltaproteobacteria bacterium]
MARNRSWTWTVIISLLVGMVGASIFWLYSPYGHDRLAQQVAEDLKAQPLPGVGPGGPVNLKKLASQAMGSRYQMVADGKEVFLVDLKNGRVWRYFHNTKEAGFSMEDEGFLPIGLYYAGKKHYTASEIEPPPVVPGNSPQIPPAGKQPQ